MQCTEHFKDKHSTLQNEENRLARGRKEDWSTLDIETEVARRLAVAASLQQ